MMFRRTICFILSVLIITASCFCSAGCTGDKGSDEAYVISETASGSDAADYADRKLAMIEWSFLSDSTRYALDASAGTVNGYDISLPFDWSCSDIDDRSTCYAIHGFKFLTELYKAYKAEQNTKYCDTIIAYMLDWVKNHPQPFEGSEWAWHDDAAARRVLRMSYFAYTLREYMGEESYARIKSNLDMQAELLADDSFYTRRHNHGMYQDMGLIAYAYLICDDAELSRDYFKLALSRSCEYYNYVFTADGAHKEHSPSYAATCMYYIRYYNCMYEGTGLAEIEQLNSLLHAATGFLSQLVMPDGVIPSIGDSTKSTIDLAYTDDSIYHGLSDNQEYIYAFSNGQHGTVPPSEAVFPEGGYAVMRSSWEDSAETATYMLFMAATHSSSHKHSDDLSFLLYHGGPLIVEAGKRDYNYLAEETAYCYSGYGHNVLLINDEEFPVRIGQNGFRSVFDEAYKTGITDYDTSSDIKYVTGVQKRFEGIVQTRTLTYCKEIDFVQVLDRIKADESCTGTLIYHIAPGVEAAETDCGWILSRNGKTIAQITVECDRNFSISTIRNNDGDSPYKTWTFDGKLESSDGTVLKIDIDCAKGTNNAAVNIQLMPLD